jgi:hypothetical protein
MENLTPKFTKIFKYMHIFISRGGVFNRSNSGWLCHFSALPVSLVYSWTMAARLLNSF